MVFEKTQAYYDAVYSFKDYAAESRKIRALIARHKRSAGRDLLDVACGTGAHLVHLRRHFRVGGVDLDPGMLKVARRKVKGAAFHRGDMATFRLSERFDVVLCLFGSIGYVRTLKGLDSTAANFARHLKPGGVLIVEPWVTPAGFKRGHTRVDAAKVGTESVARLARTWRRGRLSVLEFRYGIASPTGFRELAERHKLGLFSLAEYRRAFERAGLKVRVYKRGLKARGVIVGLKPL